MKHIIIESDSQDDFANTLDLTCKNVNVYGVQYQPVVAGGKIWYTALVFYKEDI
jgi:hypothetical protein